MTGFIEIFIINVITLEIVCQAATFSREQRKDKKGRL